MNIDSNKVIERLLQRVASLEGEKAMLQVALEMAQETPSTTEVAE